MRSLILLAVATLLAACGGGSSGSGGSISPVTPPVVLAADQLVFDSTRLSANRELYMMKTDGTGIMRLTNNAAYEHWWPRISPDRKKILFYRRPAGVQDDDYAQASLWVMNADGSGVTQLIAQGANGWVVQGHAEWSPDGTKLAMFGTVGSGSSLTAQIFVTNANGGSPVQYTNQPGINTDVSWSPDGSKLLFNGCPASPCVPANYEIFVMSATAPLSTPTRLTNDNRADYDPYFSPNGLSIAWLTNFDPTANPTVAGPFGAWGIQRADFNAVMPMSISNLTTVINDGQINSKPAWSLDGSVIYFHRMNLTEEFRYGVFRIGSTGTGLVRLTATNTGINEFPAN